VKATKILPLLALVVLSSLLFIPNAHASDNIVDHYNLTGQKGRMQVSIYVYKASDTVPTKDFYTIRIFANFNEWIYRAIMDLSSQNGICDYWKPTAGFTGDGEFGFSYMGISFAVGIPGTTNVIISGGFTNYIKIDQAYFWDSRSTEFSTGWWVPQGQRLNWKLKLCMYDELQIWIFTFPIERDRVTFETWSG